MGKRGGVRADTDCGGKERHGSAENLWKPDREQKTNDLAFGKNYMNLLKDMI